MNRYYKIGLAGLLVSIYFVLVGSAGFSIPIQVGLIACGFVSFWMMIRNAGK